MSARTRAGKLIPIASLLVLAISGVPVAVCSAMPACPMTAAAAVAMEGMGGCHPVPASEGDSCDESRIRDLPCCELTSQPATPVARELSVHSSTPLPLMAAAPVFVPAPVATARSVSPRAPAPRIFGRDLLSRHQAFLL